MKRFAIKHIIYFFLLLLTIFISGCTGVPSGVKPVTNFELNRYLGKWYEIARLENRYEEGLTEVYAVYTLNKDGSVSVFNTGFNPKENLWEEANGKAYMNGEAGEGRLKVTFFWPFYGAYNIILLDDNYQYAVVCGSSKSTLWILSRTQVFPIDLLNQYLLILKKAGFDTEALIFNRQ